VSQSAEGSLDLLGIQVLDASLYQTTTEHKLCLPYLRIQQCCILIEPLLGGAFNERCDLRRFIALTVMVIVYLHFEQE